MFWHTPGSTGLHGVTITRINDEYHLFTTKGDDIARRTVQHSVSRDLLRWQSLPDALGVGRPGDFDGHTLYDLHVFAHAGTCYLFYTGLDIPMGPGQRQAVGLATSTDLIHWKRHANTPVLEGSPHYYEPFVPDHATYQEKDRRRQWFRDPWVYRDPVTGKFGMAIGARAAGEHPDVNGCFAWAESDDLIHWTPQPPLFCPRRFHTVECPVIFEQDGRTYLIWLTHPEWGTPLVTTDPWQRAGDLYAFSDQGLHGPWRTPQDEILIGGAYDLPGKKVRRMRAMVARTITHPGPQNYVSYHLNAAPAPGDTADGSPWLAMAKAGTVMPLLKPLRTRPDGDIELGCNPVMDTLLDPHDTPDGVPAPDWTRADAAWRGKNFSASSVQLLDATMQDGLFAAQIRLNRGLRAGLILRARDPKGPGLRVLLDQNLGCIEFGLLDTPEPIDRRRWQPRGGWIDLRILAHGPSLEIYCDNKLMLSQIRYRETAGRIGLCIDQAEADFRALDLRTLKPGTPLLQG